MTTFEFYESVSDGWVSAHFGPEDVHLLTDIAVGLREETVSLVRAGEYEKAGERLRSTNYAYKALGELRRHIEKQTAKEASNG